MNRQSCTLWSCLYTRHKKQKRKRWLDGTAKYCSGNGKVGDLAHGQHVVVGRAALRSLGCHVPQQRLQVCIFTGTTASQLGRRVAVSFLPVASTPSDLSGHEFETEGY